VRHDADSSSEQKRRRQWDDQDVDHLLSVLDNAELSSSCSTSRTSCSESVSQSSCMIDDVADTATAAAQHQDHQGMLTGGDAALQPSKCTGLPHLPFCSPFYFILKFCYFS